VHLTLKHDLPFVNLFLRHRGASLMVSDVLIDTGSASIVVAADSVAAIGIAPESTDVLRTLRGVGGREVVFTRTLDQIGVGECGLEQFLVEIGGMDYGFNINGILGMDFLSRSRAVIDLGRRAIDFPRP
jgi:predicted aspartyl protease